MPQVFLSELADFLRLNASVFMRLQLGSPWGMELPSKFDLRMHVLTRGSCWLGGRSLGGPLRLRRGEIALLGGGQEYWIADKPGRPLIPSTEAELFCQQEHHPFQTDCLTHELICGTAQLTSEDSWLSALLPEIVVIRRRGDASSARAWSIVDAIVASSKSLKDDDTRVLDRLAEALFLSLLSRVPAVGVETEELSNARSSPEVRKAVALMHSQIGRPWTLEKLAKEVGASRAALVRNFKSSLGKPLKSYLTEVRMARAKRLLLAGASLPDAARAVGYRSSEAFRKAFKRSIGQTPADYLRGSTNSGTQSAE